MKKHIEPEKDKGEVALESCRQKLFSMFHNLTENDDVCKELSITDFIKYTNKMFRTYSEQNVESGNINELAIKSLINICHHNKEALDDETNELRDLLENIARLYNKFENLAKQYSLRLVTILTRQWK